MLTCIQLQFKGPSRDLGRLLYDRLSNVRLKHEIG